MVDGTRLKELDSITKEDTNQLIDLKKQVDNLKKQVDKLIEDSQVRKATDKRVEDRLDDLFKLLGKETVKGKEKEVGSSNLGLGFPEILELDSEATRMGKRLYDDGEGVADEKRSLKVQEEEKEVMNLCLCFSFDKGTDRKYLWFIMNPLVANSAADCILMSEINRSDLPLDCSTVVYDSKIFFIGGFLNPFCYGDFFPSPEASFIDIARFRNAALLPLEKAPLMIMGKCTPVVAAVDGKIYVVGMTEYHDNHFVKPWAEVFDIETSTWSDLPFPPDKVLKQNTSLAKYVYHEKMNRIITSYPSSDSNSNDLLYFDITTCSWLFLLGMGDLRSTLESIDGTPAVVDDDLYLMYGRHNNLFVASLVKPAAMVPVHGLEVATESLKIQSENYEVYPFLSHLGNGLLCLVWCVPERRYFSHVHCLNFRVSKMDGGEPHAVIVRLAVFEMNDMAAFCNCLPIVMRNTTISAVDPEIRQITLPSGDSLRRSTRHARRVLVNDLPPETDAYTIASFFTDNIVLEPGHNDTGSVVLDVYINRERNFAIVELNSEEQANSAMVLGDPRLNDVPLTICRPADYQHPPPIYDELFDRALFCCPTSIDDCEDKNHC